MEKETITRGLIKDILIVGSMPLSFIILSPLEEGVREVKIPFYEQILETGYTGKYVELKTICKGQSVIQEMEGLNFKKSIELPKLMINQINNEYNRRMIFDFE